MSSPSKKNTLLIGIDFGTTYSGVAWLFCKDKANPGRPEVVTRWLSTLARNADRQKVPSKIHYDPNSGDVTWGYNIPTDVVPLQWFKRLLLDQGDIQEHLRESPHLKTAREMMVALGKTPVEIIGDYLGQLWKHIMQEIEDEKGANHVRGTPIHVVITVPAIWKDYTRDRMRQAASHAGILEKRLIGNTTLSFISEPEAAALATVPELEGRGDLDVDDTFTVCDCGGGTVVSYWIATLFIPFSEELIESGQDIISYKVEKLEPLAVSECVEGDGALCGTTFLDEDFESFMKKTITSKVWDEMDRADIAKMLNNEWEHGIKPDFDGSGKSWVVDLPKRGKRGQLLLKTDQIRQIFDNVTTQIHRLVYNQIQAIQAKTGKPPKFIILVGGFGRCPYTFKSLKDRHEATTEVLQARGDRPWSAICRGAALFGAMGEGLSEGGVLIRSRVSRLSYGWLYRPKFVAGKHNEADKVWDSHQAIYTADNQFEWGLKKGQTVLTQEPKIYPYIRFYKIRDKGFPKASVKIYICDMVHPPSRKGDEGHQYLGEFKFEGPTRIENLRVRNLRGNKCHVFAYELKLEVSGASLNLTVLVEGREVGAKCISVAQD
ncbi:hypothetical protein BJ170DRAFT_712255 [Xylariales sp. AK1849]|nr:hypothetical protein BJ170DRAFT_712255 [Xylariales sp. AK1849]